MSKITAYCSYDFILNLINNESIKVLEDNRIMTQLQMRELIFKRSIIKVDVSRDQILPNTSKMTKDEKDKIIKQINPYIIKIVKSRDIEYSFEFDKLIKNSDDFFKKNVSYFNLFLLSKNYKENICDFQNYYGYYFFITDSDYSQLFESKVKQFGFNKTLNWKSTSELLGPHNSCIISHPYIFKKESLENLVQLLALNIKPDLKLNYYLTLIGKSGYQIGSNPRTKKPEILTSDNINNNISLIRNTLKTKFNSKINFEIEWFVINNKEYHTRQIITNNSYIFSGNDLDITKGSTIKKEEIWHIVKPFVEVNIDGIRNSSYSSLIVNQLNILHRWIKSLNKEPKNPLFKLASSNN